MGPIGYQSQVIQRPIPQSAASKAGVPGMTQAHSRELLVIWFYYRSEPEGEGYRDSHQLPQALWRIADSP